MLIIVVVVVAFGGYRFGFTSRASYVQEMAMLKQTVANLNEENHKLTQQLNILRVELEVAQQAAKRSQGTITDGLKRERQLQEQLAFYQKVMAPELQQQGFVIDAFNVTQTLSDDRFRFELVLMQLDKIKHTIKGNIQVTLHGTVDGQPQQLALQPLMPEGTEPLVFSFKYFQVIEGEFVLPPGFTPERVDVASEVFQFRKKRGELTRSFVWQAQMTGTTE